MSKQGNTAFLIFYLLVAYILAQFFWWTYLIMSLNQELYILREDGDIDTKFLMILGEGSIFLILLIVGALQIRKTFKKEISLAQQQNNFLLSITHELKSPLASIKLQIETLIKHDLETKQQNEIFSKVLLDANRLNDLVDNVLLASQINDESFVLDKQNQNIVPIISELVVKFSKYASNFNIEFSSKETELILPIDSMAFSSIVINLIENALKYSDQNSNILVALGLKSEGIVLVVKDEGSGISDEDKSKVFDKFYRGNDELRRKTKGTGLGLYIVKYLVSKHNGSILIKDNSPKGSIFEVTFNKN